MPLSVPIHLRFPAPRIATPEIGEESNLTPRHRWGKTDFSDFGIDLVAREIDQLHGRGSMILIAEDVLAAKEAVLEASELLPGHTPRVLVEDPVTGRCFRFYLMLTYLPELLADLRLYPTQLFRNRVYWFARYARLQRG